MKAQINGVELFYEVDGSGRPLFVIHGGLGLDHQAYRRTLQPLAIDHQLIFMDVRGNGQSSRIPNDQMTIEAMADDVAELATQLGHETFLVFGHSWGGFIAQEVVLRHPQRVTGVLLVAARPGQLGRDESPDEHPIPPRPAGLLAAEEPSDDETFRVFWEAIAPYFTTEEALPELLTALDGTVYCLAAGVQSDVIYETWSTIDRLANIEVPVLVLVGSLDLINSPADSARIADRLRFVTVVELAGASHFPWIEKPDEFYAAVSEWLLRNQFIPGRRK